MEVQCNAGESYILKTDTEIIIDFDEVIELEKLLHNPLPEDWQSLKVIIRPVHHNIVLTIGASDSGKTTLIKYLALNLPKNKHSVGIIDLDVGQNSIGIPGTINFGDFKSSGTSLVSSRYFGFLSPAGNSGNYLSLIKEFFNKIISFEYDWIFIDTSGYIQTKEALEIIRGIINISNPQFTILLGQEAKKLINNLPTRNVIYHFVSSAIEGIKKEKTPELRRKKRSERFREYFKNANNRVLLIDNIDRILIYDHDKRIEIQERYQIMDFLASNKSELINLFISYTLEGSNIPNYAIIKEITAVNIILFLKVGVKLSKELTIEIGDIYLNRI